MVLTHAEEMQANLVGEHALLDNVTKCLRLRLKLAVRADRHIAEGIYTQFNRIRHVLYSVSWELICLLLVAQSAP